MCLYRCYPGHTSRSRQVFQQFGDGSSFPYFCRRLRYLCSPRSSAIKQYFMTLRHTGRAKLAYFYFDFRDEEKQDVRNLVTSLLTQISASSKPCCDIICCLYSAYGKDTRQPGNRVLMDRLKEMLAAAARHQTFVIIGVLDECPSSGMPTPREADLPS